MKSTTKRSTLAAEDYTDIVHTGPGTLAGRYMRRFWHPVYRGEDLAPGQAVPIQVMSEHLTLYRGEGGAPHLVAQRCAHRGTQLSAGWVEGDCIRCFYHGWMYDASGQCVEQPGEDESFAAKVQIRSYQVQEYLGLAFAYLGDGAPPPLPRYPEFEDPGVLDIYPPEYWPCNFFNRIDNACDLAHLSFAHRESRRAINNLQDLPTISAEETEYGVVTSGMRPGRPTQSVHFHMPNINQFIIEGDLKLRDAALSPAGATMGRLLIRVPVDDERCVSFPLDHVSLAGEAGAEYLKRRRALEEAQLAAPESPEDMAAAVLEGRLRVGRVREKDPVNLKTLTSVEDYVAQVGQGPIADHATERLGRMDVGVALVRSIWQRELRALAEGAPLKRWSRTRRLRG